MQISYEQSGSNSSKLTVYGFVGIYYKPLEKWKFCVCLYRRRATNLAQRDIVSYPI